MYCSVCKLMVADDNVANCPICQGPLRPEGEVREEQEPLELKEAELFDLAKEMQAGWDGEVESDSEPGISLDEGPAFDPQLDLEALKLDELPSGQSNRENVDDIRVLADLWAKEDLGADLDGVLAETFSAENSAAREESAINTEPGKPVYTGSSTAVVNHGKHLHPWLLLSLVAGLILVAGGGWYYFYNNIMPAETEVVVGEKHSAPEPVKSQVITPQEDKSSVSEKEVRNDVDAEVGSEAVETETPEPEAVEAVDDSQLNSSLAATTDDKVEPVPSAADSGPVQIVAAGSNPVLETIDNTAVDTMVPSETHAEIERTPETVPETEARMKSDRGVSVAAPSVVEAQIPAAGSAEPVGAVKTELHAEIDQQPVAASPAEAVSGPCYVVHIGSFKTAAGAARQLAKVQEKGFAAYKVEVNLGEKGVWQRIFVPGGVGKSEAKQVQDKLKQLLPHEESRIIRVNK